MCDIQIQCLGFSFLVLLQITLNARSKLAYFQKYITYIVTLAISGKTSLKLLDSTYHFDYEIEQELQSWDPWDLNRADQDTIQIDNYQFYSIFTNYSLKCLPNIFLRLQRGYFGKIGREEGFKNPLLLLLCHISGVRYETAWLRHFFLLQPHLPAAAGNFKQWRETCSCTPSSLLYISTQYTILRNRKENTFSPLASKSPSSGEILATFYTWRKKYIYKQNSFLFLPHLHNFLAQVLKTMPILTTF